jgi:hypothetical protein
MHFLGNENTKLTKRLAAAALAISLGLGAAQASTVIYANDFTGQEGEGLFGDIFAGDSFDASNGQWNISFCGRRRNVI